jgi:hypothetical protein
VTEKNYTEMLINYFLFREQELKERHVFLFNDLILFTKLNKKKYQFKEVLRFYNSTAQDQPDNASTCSYYYDL